MLATRILFSSSFARFLHLTILLLGHNLPQGRTEQTGNKKTRKTRYGGSDVHYVIRNKLVLPFDRLMRKTILDRSDLVTVPYVVWWKYRNDKTVIGLLWGELYLYLRT
jgi:hypothetical protein